MRARWQFPSPIPPEAEVELGEFSPVEQQILFSRGLVTRRLANDFLAIPAFAGGDPYLIQNMDAAVDRILEARGRDEAVVVYGDYDTDGVTASALLVSFLRRVGIRATSYIPNRFEEGYGLNQDALLELRRGGAQLVITVDCGIRSADEVALARSAGTDVIVTDHHQPGGTLPLANAVINPKQPGDTYPFKELAGVGLAYKLAQAVARKLGEEDPEDLLDLVAVGTISDLAPLIGENRHLVTRGLEVLNRKPREGLRELTRVSGFEVGNVRAMGVSFGLGPRLNAAGRMSTAEAAYDLLMAEDTARAARIAQALDQANRERQKATRDTVQRARAMAVTVDEVPTLIFAAAPDFSEGIIGLAAARLVDEYYRPSIVAARGRDVTRGSARSIPEFHITRALDECSDLLLKYGGHSAAAGFSLRTEHLDTLLERLNRLAAEALGAGVLAPSLGIDAVVRLGDLQTGLLHFLERLEPCGSGNPAPILAARDVRVHSKKTVGGEGRHLKLVVGDSQRWIEAIAFGHGPDFRQVPDRIDLAFRLERNNYWGQETLELHVSDWRPAEPLV
jgi:single-stranded-DNA-specific exonuclease